MTEKNPVPTNEVTVMDGKTEESASVSEYLFTTQDPHRNESISEIKINNSIMKDSRETNTEDIMEAINKIVLSQISNVKTQSLNTGSKTQTPSDKFRYTTKKSFQSSTTEKITTQTDIFDGLYLSTTTPEPQNSETLELFPVIMRP